MLFRSGLHSHAPATDLLASVRECRPASPQPKAKTDSGPVSRFTGHSRPLYPRRFRRTPRSDVAPKARTTRKRPPKDTNSSIYQLIRLKFAGGGEIAIFVQQNPTEEFKPFVTQPEERRERGKRGTAFRLSPVFSPTIRKKKAGPFRIRLEEAATYSPTGKPQYHRR